MAVLTLEEIVSDGITTTTYYIDGTVVTESEYNDAVDVIQAAAQAVQDDIDAANAAHAASNAVLVAQALTIMNSLGITNEMFQAILEGL